jgi:ferritin-like metal-binding protein YciE
VFLPIVGKGTAPQRFVPFDLNVEGHAVVPSIGHVRARVDRVRVGGRRQKGELMAAITEPRELLVNELKAMLYVERKQADEVLPQLNREITNTEFKQSVAEHIEETKQHIANLERAFEVLGEEPKPDKSHAVDGLVAQHDKVFKNIEADELRDMFNAGAAAKTEHLEIAAYESMITNAESLGENEIVDLLQQNLGHEKQALEDVKNVSEQLASRTPTI